MDASAARRDLMAMINAGWASQAVAAAAELGLADLLGDGPRDAAWLARKAGAHAPSMQRLLRALTSLGVCEHADDDAFALTPLGRQLRRNVPGSLAAWALLVGRQASRAWSELAESVRSGESSRKRKLGRDGFYHLDADSEAAALFNRAMVDLTRPVAAELAAKLDLSEAALVVDVGGGSGELALALLARYPQLRAIVFDLGHAAAAAAERIGAAGVAERCRFVAGSFFDQLPRDGDAYVLKSVLHNWDDESCAAILATCRAELGPLARLVVVERLAPARFDASPADQEIARSDLNMLVSCGGRERTQMHLESLLRQAGFRPGRVTPLCGGYSALEASLIKWKGHS